MYDIKKNGVIELEEMTKIMSSLYEMANLPSDNAEKSAVKIFNRMDTNHDGVLSEQEFSDACLMEEDLVRLLAPNSL